MCAQARRKSERERRVFFKKEMEAPTTPPAFAPQLLLVLESCFLDEIDCFQLLQEKVSLGCLLEWERMSLVLRDGLEKINWWERYFEHHNPITYKRLVVAAQCSNDWRRLAISLHDVIDCVVWKESLEVSAPIVDDEETRNGVLSIYEHVSTAVGADEFGHDCVHQLLRSAHKKNHAVLLRKFTWNTDVTANSKRDSVTRGYFDFQKSEYHLDLHAMAVVRAWTVPFKDAVVVLLQNRFTGQEDVVWVKTGSLATDQDLRFWALSCPVTPISLNGSSSGCTVVIASTAVAKGCSAVTVGGHTVLIFDTKHDGSDTATWREMLSAEVFYPHPIAVTAACYVFDAFLLLATNDGIVHARPRANPRSSYYIENLNSLVQHMSSLYNVVAVIHSYSVLEVRLVKRIAEDPFLEFAVLYKLNNVDCDHAPLLYGPYVIFAGLDGCWYRVKYDSATSYHAKEQIKVPFHGGWSIVSIKSANWDYMLVLVQEPLSRRLSELFLFQ